MAVVNVYVQTNNLNSPSGTLITPDNPLYETGTKTLLLKALFQPGSTDSNGSVYRLWANVPTTYVPAMICIASDALAGTTSASLGVYLPNGGAVVSAALFCSAISLATAITTLDPRYAIDGLAAIGLANSGMSLNGLLSYTPGYQSNVDIALTINTTTGATGNIAVMALFTCS